MAWVGGREIPDASFGTDATWASGQLVPETTWVHPDLFIPDQPPRAPGRYGDWARSPYALGGVVVGVAVAATLVVCLAGAWVTTHATVVGIGIAAVAGSALALLRALTDARNAGPPVGGAAGGDTTTGDPD